MMKEVSVYCVNLQRLIQVPEGSSLLDVCGMISDEYPARALCARVNNKTEDLSYRLYNPKQVEFVDIADRTGLGAYVRSLCFVLYKAVEEVFPGTRLRIEHSLSKGYYGRLTGMTDVSDEVIARLKRRMQEIIEADMPFERVVCPAAEAVEIFRRQGLDDKIALLETLNPLYTVYYRLGDRADYYQSCLVPSTGYLTVFDLLNYDGGLLLVPPSADCPQQTADIVPQPKMLEAFEEYVRFNRIAGLSNVGNLNRTILSGRATDLIKVTEALHEKKIAALADEIARRHKTGEARIILIAGPSSSGKTTFSKRLSVQLMTHLLRPVAISLDDYFVNREDTPRDESGDYDYESLYALDLESFNRDLTRLLDGEEIEVPSYNFETGKRVYRGNRLKLEPSSVLIMEGIHALNPALTPQIADNLKFRIYVSALTSISIDDHNWVPTSDNRLLRRIIRDYKYRGSSAKDTIARWPSVRRGEEKWIFPYQENADAMFNSALLFELAVMKNHASPVLAAVPRNCKEYSEANRLLHFLDFFLPLPEREIPPTSLLREFLGGSSFKY